MARHLRPGTPENEQVASAEVSRLLVLGFVVAEDLNGAVAGTEQAGEDAEQRGLSCAVFADEDIAAARFKIDRNLTQRGEGAEELGNLMDSGTEGRACGHLGCRGHWS